MYTRLNVKLRQEGLRIEDEGREDVTGDHVGHRQDRQEVVDAPVLWHGDTDDDEAKEHDDPGEVVKLVPPPHHRNLLEEVGIVECLGGRGPRDGNLKEMVEQRL